MITQKGLAPAKATNPPAVQRRTQLCSTEEDQIRSLTIMSNRNYNNRLSKFIVAKANGRKLCDCPNSEPEKIITDIRAHLPGCPNRKKLQSGRFTVNTSVTPGKFNDGCSLGIALGEEYY